MPIRAVCFVRAVEMVTPKGSLKLKGSTTSFWVEGVQGMAIGFGTSDRGKAGAFILVSSSRAGRRRILHAFLEISLIFHLRIETILERKRQANGLEGPIYCLQNMLTFRCPQQGLRSSITHDRYAACRRPPRLAPSSAACVELRHQQSTPHYSVPHP